MRTATWIGMAIALAARAEADDNDLQHRLSSTRIADVDLRGETLEESIRLLADMSGIFVSIDADVDLEGPVTLRLHDVTARTAFRLLLAPRNLTLRARDGLVAVQGICGHPAPFVTRPYDVRDLARPVADFPGPQIGLATEEPGILLWPADVDADPPSASELEEMLRAQTAGGEAGWEGEDVSLQVLEGPDGSPRFVLAKHAESVHDEIAALLAALRTHR